MKIEWSQLSLYALSLVIGLVLDVFMPNVKHALCDVPHLPILLAQPENLPSTPTVKWEVKDEPFFFTEPATASKSEYKGLCVILPSVR